VDCAFWQWNDVWLSEGFRSFDIRAECARINAPVLAIQGQDDAYGTMAQIDEIARCMAPSGRIALQTLEQCGHSPHKDQPDQVSGILKATFG
jgi:pimeloyl-ACP methyl ester carboxylesterase